MPFFKKKKKEEVVFPEFPALPKEAVPAFPPYSPKEFPSLKEIKQAIKPMNESKEFPRLEAMPKLTETITYEPKNVPDKESKLPSIGKFMPMEKEAQLEIQERRYPMPAMPRERQMMPRMQPPRQRPIQQPQMFRPIDRQLQPRYEAPRSGKPLFVQIDEYNRIIETVNNLKFSLQEAERILGSLKQMKEKENEELSRWDAHLNKVKDKLLMIDKRLFEP